MEEKKEKRQRLVIIISIIAFVVMVVVVIILAIIDSQKTGVIDIMVTPKDSVISLNGKKYKNGSYRVFPGEYSINITHDELEPYNETVVINNGDEVKLYQYLVGKDDDMSWYLTHEEDSMILTGIGDYYANIASQQYVASDPIFAITPYYNYDKGFKINAAKGDDKNEIIVFLYTCDDDKVENLKKNANGWLNKQEINLDNYNIVYKYCD